MLVLATIDWERFIVPVIIMVVVIVVLKIAYAVKPHAEIPPKKPKLCWLPKYKLRLPVVERLGVEDDLSEALMQLGFRQTGELQFSRGSGLGDFSIKIAKVIVTAESPLTNPLALRVEYGAVCGVAFDNGDLWKFCDELGEKLRTNLDDENHVHQEQTGNPYQPPMTS